MKQVFLNGKKGKDLYFIIDDDDYEDIKIHKWYYNSVKHYVSTVINNKKIYIHRYIMLLHNKDIHDKCIDHINNNKLDNRKDNLRICSNKENTRNRKIPKNNTTGFKGVYKYSNNRFYIKFYFEKKPIAFEIFDNVIDAAKKYDFYAKKYFGEFSNLNFKN
jgi:hypothetical protein